MLLENDFSKCIEMLFNVKRDDIVLQPLNDQHFESGYISDQIFIPRQHEVIKKERLLGELLYS